MVCRCQRQIDAIVTTDLITFGLVLHASVINELEHLPVGEHGWKSIQNGIAIAFITLYGALYALAIFGDKVQGVVNSDAILACGMLFAAMSAALTLATVRHLAKRSSR